MEKFRKCAEIFHFTNIAFSIYASEGKYTTTKKKHNSTILIDHIHISQCHVHTNMEIQCKTLINNKKKSNQFQVKALLLDETF